MTRTHEKVRYAPKGERYTVLTAAQSVEDALKVLEGRWKLIILFHLFGGKVLRFSDLERAIPAISQKCSSSSFGKWRRMASFGGRVVGKEEIRSYWTRQWKEFDPHVEPLEVIDQEGGITEVKVHQLVKSLGGDVLSDSEVWHVYTIANGLIESMDLRESETRSDATPSTAFSRH